MKKIIKLFSLTTCIIYLVGCTTIIPTIPIIKEVINNNTNTETNINISGNIGSKKASYTVDINQKYLSKEKDGRTYLKTEYPLITINGATDNTALLDTINEINKYQEKEANDFMENTDEAAISMLFETDLYDDTMYFTQESKIRVDRSDDKLLVLANQIYYDGGGAHPSSNTLFTNIYVPNGQKLDIDDVLNDKDGFYITLKEELKKQNPDFGFYDDWENTIDIYKKGYFDGGDEDEELRYPVKLNFELLSDKLNVYFNPYELGPYVSGGIGVNLPYSEFPGLVKDEYK